MILDLFAGPGGWDTGLRLAGHTGLIVGIEHDAAACATAHAAGHPRIRADVATYPTAPFVGKVDGLIASPPCQAWSTAGKQLGQLDQAHVYARIADFAAGREPETVDWADERSKLTAEPMRWAAALRPRWIACEQVPAVLPLWQYMGELLRGLGYQVWTGILSAEEYGVPQTRKRAILTARMDGPVSRPVATHQRYRAGQAPLTAPDLFGDPLPPPVSMAQALGWGLPERPAWTVTSGGTETGGAEVFGSAASRAELRGVVAQARNSGPGAERDPRPVAAASYTIRAQGSGSHPSGTEWVLRNGPQENATDRRADEPAGTVYCSRPGNLEWVRTGNNSRVGGGETVDYQRETSAPAPTLTGNVSRWQIDRPATTVCADARIAPPGHRDRAGGELQFGEGTVRVSVEEAPILQSFPAGYPWQGTKSKQYEQVGNAVPPLLAAAIVRPLLARVAERAA